MDEYISKTELLRVINTDIAEAHNERCVQLLNAILYATTADVVSKSEYDRLKKSFQEAKGYLNRLYGIRVDVASEIFAEIESKKMFLKDCAGNMGVVVLFKDIAELKKKYTEEKNEVLNLFVE